MPASKQRTYWAVRQTCQRVGDVGLQMGPQHTRNGCAYVNLIFSDGVIESYPLGRRTSADLRQAEATEHKNRLERLPQQEGDDVFCTIAEMNGMPPKEISEYFGIPLDKLPFPV